MAKTATEEIKLVISMDSSGVSKGTDELGSSVGGATSSFSGLFTAMKKISAALVGFGLDASNVAIAYDKAMNTVAAVTGLDLQGDEIEALNDKVFELGISTPRTMSEIAGAMEIAGKAGLNYIEIMDAMPATIQLSVIADTNLDEVTDSAAKIMRAFDIPAEQFSDVVDAMAVAATNAPLTVTDLATSMQYAAINANEFGFSLNETASAIGVMAANGITGSRAGTQLRQMMLKLAAPTNQAQEAMDELGFTAYDSQGNMKGLEQIIGELTEKTKDMTDEQKFATMKTIFQTRALSSMLALMTDTDEEAANLGITYAEMGAKLEDAGGAAQRMYDTIQEGSVGTTERLHAVQDAVKNIFGEKVNEILDPMKEFFTRILVWVAELDDETLEFITTFGAMFVAITAVVGVVLGLVAVLSMLSGPALIVAGIVIALTALGTFLVGFMKTGLLEELLGPRPDLNGLSSLSEEEIAPFIKKMKALDESMAEFTITGLISEEDLAEMKRTFEDVTTYIETNYMNRLKAAQTMILSMDLNPNMSDERRQEVLNALQSSYDEKITKIEENEASIQAIQTKIYEENRKATLEEQLEIQRITDMTQDMAVQSLTTNVEDKQLLLDHWNYTKKEITQQAASDLLVEQIAARDKAMQASDDDYAAQLNAIEDSHKAINGLTDEEYKLMLSDAETAYNAQQNAATEAYEGIVTAVKQNLGEASNTLDYETGKMLTRWDRFKSNIDAGVSNWKSGAAIIKKKWQHFWGTGKKDTVVDPSGAGGGGGGGGLAKGGIVDKATIALIGEGAYPEAVVPLSAKGISDFIGGVSGKSGLMPGDGVTINNNNTYQTGATLADIQGMLESQTQDDIIAWELA